MTTDEFASDPKRREDLAKILADPIFTAAVAAVSGEIQPAAFGQADVNPVLGNARYHQVAGLNYLVNGLAKLTQAPAERKKLAPISQYTDRSQLPKKD